MKMIVLLSLSVAMLTGCVSAKTREEGKVTCLTANKTYQKPNDLGFSCKDKADQEQRDFKVEY